MPKLSVIVAAYNAEKYLDRCIVSCLNQTEFAQNCELIVINDGSSDGTENILVKYKNNIKIINLEKNSGSVARVRNIGLDAANGEYITFLDADDWYEKNALKLIFDGLERYNPDIIRFGYTLVYPDGTRRLPNKKIGRDEFVEKKDFTEKIYPKFINGIELNSVWAVFRRETVKNIRFCDKLHTAEDLAFAVEAYTSAQNVLFIAGPIYCYCRAPGSLTGSGTGILKKYKCNFKISAKILRYLKKWNLNTAKWKLLTLVRPIRLTVDKLKRHMAD